jgi:hypothetical protein
MLSLGACVRVRVIRVRVRGGEVRVLRVTKKKEEDGKMRRIRPSSMFPWFRDIKVRLV